MLKMKGIDTISHLMLEMKGIDTISHLMLEMIGIVNIFFCITNLMYFNPTSLALSCKKV